MAICGDEDAHCPPDCMTLTGPAKFATTSNLPPGEASRHRKLTIGIMGTPLSSGNRGVLALGASLARLSIEAAPDVEVVLFGSHRDNDPVVMRPLGRDHRIKMVAWRLSPRGPLRQHLFVIVAASFFYRFVPFKKMQRWLAETIPWIGALETTDVVGDVRGGDSFSDIYGLERFLVATLPVASVIWVKGTIVQFPQTYGPYTTLTARFVARWILRRSSTIIARDTTSQAIAQELVGARHIVQLSPDVAFALHVDPLINVHLDGRTFEPLPSQLIGLNVNGLMFNGGYTGKNMFGLKMNYRLFLTELVKRLLSVHCGRLILVPHTYASVGDAESDNDASRQLKESLPVDLRARVSVVTGEYDAHQLKSIIGQSDFFVGSRMHSCIGALSQGVPCVGVAYSMKFQGVFASVGMERSIIDARSVDSEEAVNRVIELYQQRDATALRLRSNLVRTRLQLSRVFSDIIRETGAARN